MQYIEDIKLTQLTCKEAVVYEVDEPYLRVPTTTGELATPAAKHDLSRYGKVRFMFPDDIPANSLPENSFIYAIKSPEYLMKDYLHGKVTELYLDYPYNDEYSQALMDLIEKLNREL